ncbi:MAG: DUF5652 family protein, partial [Minisyncoccia bacterium]
LENHQNVFLGIYIWTIIWKGLALWKSAQRKEKVWFAVILILNTLGLLDILYLFVFSREKREVFAPKGIDKKDEKEENVQT